MRGTAYAVVEILIFLVATTAIGFFLGWLWPWRGRPSADQAKAADRSPALETQALILEGRLAEVTERLEKSMAESAELRTELSIAESKFASLLDARSSGDGEA